MKRKNKMVRASRNLIVVEKPKSVISEQLRTLRTNIKFAKPEEELKTLLCTSALPGEGKSTIVANIACLFASEGKRVILLDADLRKPTVHYTFGLKNVNGLSNLLSKQISVAEAIIQSHIKNLDVIPSGLIPPNPSELISNGVLELLIKHLSNEYDLIIFDAPPLLAVTDAQILSNKVDGSILIVNKEKTTKFAAKKAVELLNVSNATILGAVMNNVEDKDTSDYSYVKYYGEKE